MLTRNNLDAQLDHVWWLLEEWRNHHPEGTRHNDEAWNEACTAMAWIEEDLRAAYDSVAFPKGSRDE